MATETCSLCGESAPRPALVCFDCVDGVDTTGTLDRTYYCSTKCESVYKPQHHSSCENKNIRKQVFRAGELLQGIFYQYRETAFDMKLKKVEKRKGILYMHEDYYKPNFAEGPLFRFPSHMISDSKDKAAMLTYLTCNEASCFMYEISKELLRDVATTIEETNIAIPENSFIVNRVYSNGMSDAGRNFNHHILTMDAKDGEAYTIDMAGAQFGQHRAVIHFNEYMNAHATEINEIQPHGMSAKQQKAYLDGKSNSWAPGKGDGPVDNRVWQVAEEFKKIILKVIKDWESARGTSICALLQLDQKRFKTSSARLLANMGREMSTFVEEWEKGGCRLAPRIVTDEPDDFGENMSKAEGNPSACVAAIREEFGYETFDSTAQKRWQKQKEHKGWAEMPAHWQDLLKGTKGKGGFKTTFI